MCGRYTISRSQRWKETYGTPPPADLLRRFNIPPGEILPLIVGSPREVVFAKWGLVPAWSKDAKSSYKMINARRETLTEKPTFRKLLTSQRCLVPADGFFEWQTDPATGSKSPWYFRLASEELFAFAGLWDLWRGEGGELRTFTIITTAANDFMKPIHERMPVILGPDQFSAWLDDGDLGVLRPLEDGLLMAHPVDKLVGDSLSCILPAATLF